MQVNISSGHLLFPRGPMYCLYPTDGTLRHWVCSPKTTESRSSDTRETLTALAFLWACLSHHITWAWPEKCWLFTVPLFKHGWAWPNRQGPFILFTFYITGFSGLRHRFWCRPVFERKKWMRRFIPNHWVFILEWKSLPGVVTRQCERRIFFFLFARIRLNIPTVLLKLIWFTESHFIWHFNPFFWIS